MLADPVEVTALLWWLAATRSQREEEEEESPSWGGQAPHRAGAQQGTEGWDRPVLHTAEQSGTRGECNSTGNGT